MQILQNSDGTPINPQVPAPAATNPAYTNVPVANARLSVNGTPYPQYGTTGGVSVPVAPNPVAVTAAPQAGITAPNAPAKLTGIPSAPTAAEIIAAAQQGYKEPGNWASAFAQGWTNADALTQKSERERNDLIQQKQDAEDRKAKQVEYLSKVAPDYAGAVQSGVLDANDAFMLFKKDKIEAAKGDTKQFQKFDDGTYGYFEPRTGEVKILGNAPKPDAKGDKAESAIGKLAADYKAGRINAEQYQAGMQAMAPKGMTIESDGQGGFRLVQGPGAGSNPKINGEEGKNAGFLLRAQDADKVITDLEGQGTSTWNKLAGAIPMGMGNKVVTEDAQRFDQAKRDFLNAVLRQESGAVIGKEEFDNADKQYFPQPGDGPKVIEQKRINRLNAISGFKIRSGPANVLVDKERAAQQQQPPGTPAPQAAPAQRQAPAQQQQQAPAAKPAAAPAPDLSSMSDADLEKIANGGD